MRKAWLGAALLAASAAASAAGDPNLAGFGWLAQLAGACWRGEHPDGRTSDVQCFTTQYDRVLRATIRITIAPPGRPPATFEGDSVFAVEPSKDHVVYTQWGSNGKYGTGVMVAEGERLRFQNRLPDGAESSLRHVWQRIDADSFRVTRERRDGDTWKEQFSVEYRRVR